MKNNKKENKRNENKTIRKNTHTGMIIFFEEKKKKSFIAMFF